VRNLDEATKRALSHWAVDSGRSLEAEIRAIPITTVIGTNPPPLFGAAEECRITIADVDRDLTDALADAWSHRRADPQREIPF